MTLSRINEVWRVVKDIDLGAMRRDAQRPFHVRVVSEDGALAGELCALLSGEGGEPGPVHPFLVPVRAREGWPALDEAPLLAVLASGDPVLAGPMASLRDHLVRHGLPVVTVVTGHTGRAVAVPRDGEWSRAAVPSLDEEAVAAIVSAMRVAMPRERQVAVARQLPAFRDAVATALIDETARVNATYAFTTGLAESVPVLTAPLALGDMLVLTKNQLVMCYRLALAHGHDGEPRALMGEVIGVLGSGVLFRQAARQLVGLIPVLGIVPKVAVAYAGTWAVGRAMTAWARTGRAVTAASVKRYSREGFERGRIVARALYDESRLRGHQASSSLARLRDRIARR